MSVMLFSYGTIIYLQLVLFVQSNDIFETKSSYSDANNIIETRSIYSNALPRCLTLDRELIGRCEHVDKFYKKDKNKIAQNTIEWTDIAIIMIIYQDSNVDKLIRAHFKTWLKQTDEGLDVVFVTDKEDERSVEEILPDAGNILAKSHIYKSPAAPDNKHIRFKVIDSLRHVEHLFHENEKKYFMKMDVDTSVFPEHLLAYIQKIDESTDGQPVLFGKTICARKNMCHAAGALYGVNRKGLVSINKYFTSNQNVHEEVHPIEINKASGNLMLHEDYMVSYAYRVETRYPLVMNRFFFQLGIGREKIKLSESNPPICYHKVIQDIGFYEYYALFYYEKEKEFEKKKESKQLRPIGKTRLIWEKHLHNFPYLRTGSTSFQ